MIINSYMMLLSPHSAQRTEGGIGGQGPGEQTLPFDDSSVMILNTRSRA
jgi:hypothetical protein